MVRTSGSEQRRRLAPQQGCSQHSIRAVAAQAQWCIGAVLRRTDFGDVICLRTQLLHASARDPDLREAKTTDLRKYRCTELWCSPDENHTGESGYYVPTSLLKEQGAG